MKLAIFNCLLCAGISLLISPIIIKWLKRLKVGQNILVYVEQHKGKTGTPTMGGMIVILSAVVGFFAFWKKNNMLASICILSMVFFGVLGFLDDFIKIKFKHNEGLKPYQKMIGQIGISIIISIFVYNSSLVGDGVVIPFVNKVVSIGWWIIPFVIVYYLAVVNSVNLIDGLDGLCSGVSACVISGIAIVLLLIGSGDMVYWEEINNIIIVSLGVVGALLGFLAYNVYPAKVFLGDTGSLAIGGFIASVFVLTRQYLLICVVGVVYVVTTLSVIIQVASYKIFKKRVFKMTPIHHHFEKTTHEAKVSRMYVIVTILISLMTISMYL